MIKAGAATTTPRDGSRDAGDKGLQRRFAIKPSTRRVLAALIDAHVYGLTAVQLAHPSIGGLDFRKRISELKLEGGYPILSIPIKGKSYHRYILQGGLNGPDARVSQA
jgi:hypothetical protein